MSPEDKEKLSGSLFKPTSAFVQPLDVPYPVDVLTPQVVSAAPKEDWQELSRLVSDLLWEIDDRRDEATPLSRAVEEVLEEIERVVNKHA